jgi:Family of unknown function (DUF5989)
MESLIIKLKDLFQSISSGLGTILEIFKSLSKSKFWWLAPMLAALIGCGIFLVLVNTVTTTMPFVYALF